MGLAGERGGAGQLAPCDVVLTAAELQLAAPMTARASRLRSPTISACRRACVVAASASFQAAICRNESPRL
jgi:hypothetical protein